MIAANYSTVRARFKEYLDQVAQGETVIVTRKAQRNAVILDMETYRQLEKAKRNAAYLTMLDEAFAQVQAGQLTEVDIDFSDIEDDEDLQDAFFIQ
ncbi:MAG: type II toxin-antitoxin system Phd/YefM family antitoxin [Oscillospiraceae bacterium]|nr:type II toxin-antitoxin system Phd/YefM family antitoxin [Oscillospiraceae bacterium]